MLCGRREEITSPVVKRDDDGDEQQDGRPEPNARRDALAWREWPVGQSESRIAGLPTEERHAIVAGFPPPEFQGPRALLLARLLRRVLQRSRRSCSPPTRMQSPADSDVEESPDAAYDSKGERSATGELEPSRDETKA
jgi:hypothetical protein